MATQTKRRSADYDPIAEALDIGHQLGRKESAERAARRVPAARRGGERAGRAQREREYREARQRTAAARARTAEVIKGHKLSKLDEAIGQAKRGGSRTGSAEANRKYREARERTAGARKATRKVIAQQRAERESERIERARRDGERRGAAQVKRASADAARESAQLGGRTGRSSGSTYGMARLSAPSLGPSGGGTGLAVGGVQRGTAVRVCVLATAIGAVAVLLRDRGQIVDPKGTVVDVLDRETGQVVQQTINVPSHLHDLAGVLVGGVVSVIVAEVIPTLGLAMGLILGFDAVASTGLTKFVGDVIGPQTIPTQPSGAAGQGAGPSSGADSTVNAQGGGGGARLNK